MLQTLKIVVLKNYQLLCVYFPLSAAYLTSLEDQELTELALHEYKTAANMTEQFAALAAIAQNPGKTRDEVLADFYTKWQHDFLVSLLMHQLFECLNERVATCYIKGRMSFEHNE